MDKMAKLINFLNAVNLVLDSDISIGKCGDTKYAYVSNEFFNDYFGALDWKNVTRYNETAGRNLTNAVVFVGGISFRASFNEDDIKEHNAHLAELEEKEATA